MAKAMPVLPDVGSMMVSPGLMTPLASASLIMLMAGLQRLKCCMAWYVGLVKVSTFKVISFDHSERSNAETPHLSLTLPAGLLPSSFARIMLEGFDDSLCSLTRGVLPTYSSIVGNC